MRIRGVIHFSLMIINLILLRDIHQVFVFWGLIVILKGISNRDILQLQQKIPYKTITTIKIKDFITYYRRNNSNPPSAKPTIRLTVKIINSTSIELFV